MRRITQTEIAKELGVSVMTVSLALRNSPRLAEETRRRVREVAERLGYQPDPALSALVSHRRQAQIKRDWATLALVTNWRTADGWRGTYIQRMFEGAAERALRIGYRLEPFWLGEYRSQAQAARVLSARGVRGLLFAPPPTGVARLRFPWHGFACVALGGALIRPRLHRVAHDYAASAELAVHELARRGYRRIGLLMNERTERITEHRTSAMFASSCARDRRILDSWTLLTKDQDDARVVAEVGRRRPDCVLTLHPHYHALLAKAGVSIPGELGFASLHIPAHMPTLAGIDYGAREIGAAGVDRVHGLLERNELGLPARPSNHLLPGNWVDGESLRPVDGVTRPKQGRRAVSLNDRRAG
jgi:DNA-binding LacI/PurR family transcriptional regulator